MSFELRQLRFAVAAADANSFSRAASNLGIQQATLSRQIMYLERRMGVMLFKRTRSGASPTEAGEAVLTQARHIIMQVDSLGRHAQAVAAASSGMLSVGFISSLTTGNLRSALFGFHGAFPDIRLNTAEDDRAVLMTKLEIGGLDIVIASGRSPTPCIRQQTLWRERMLVGLPTAHPLSSQELVCWQDLHDETFLCSRFTGEEMEQLVNARRSQPGFRPTIVWNDISRESLLASVSAGLGIVLMSEASQGNRIEGVIFRDLHDQSGPVVMDLSAYWRADNCNEALDQFLKFLRERYAFAAAAG